MWSYKGTLKNAPMSVPKITQHQQIFACMIEMLLDHRLDSARLIPVQQNPAYGQVALQSCKQILGNVAYFSGLSYLCGYLYVTSYLIISTVAVYSSIVFSKHGPSSGLMPCLVFSTSEVSTSCGQIQFIRTLYICAMGSLLFECLSAEAILPVIDSP